MNLLNLLAIGFGLGVRHAVEADHVAAVSTLASRVHSFRRSALTGVMWGVGHTSALLVAGVIILLFQIKIPERFSMMLEFCVGIMLVGLGFYTLRLRGERHGHTHTHDGGTHTHIHYHGPEPRSFLTSFLIGTVHGLAGSGSFMLLFLTGVQNIFVGISYILIFGLGSIGAMGVMSALISMPVIVASQSHTKIEKYIRYFSGAVSMILGVYLMYQIGYVEGLLLKK